jgi:hypothetical protein
MKPRSKNVEPINNITDPATPSVLTTSLDTTFYNDNLSERPDFRPPLAENSTQKHSNMIAQLLNCPLCVDGQVRGSSNIFSNLPKTQQDELIESTLNSLNKH